MPKPTLTYEELCEVLSYNPDTGAFAWKPGAREHSLKPGVEIGSIDGHGRRCLSIHRKTYGMHRLAWMFVYKEWPEGSLIPKNGNYLDLRIENFRLGTAQEISRHSKDRKDGSGTRGVTWDKSRGKWVAGITVDYKRRYLGRFDSKEEASAVYEAARSHAFDSTDASVMEQKRETARVMSRYHALWKRTLRVAGGVAGWSDVHHFMQDIGPELRDRLSLAPIDPDKPIGPGNWKWDVTLFSQHDTSTREGRREYERANRARNPLHHRDNDLRKAFGLSLVDYMKMLEVQNGVCASCGRPEKEMKGGKLRWLAVDHCHASGAIRELLCGACNRGLGNFEDNPDLLRKAAAYLERHKGKTKH